MHEKLHAHPVPSTVQEVADRLRIIRSENPTEGWQRAAGKIEAELGIAIALEDGDGEKPHGRIGIDKALSIYWIRLRTPEGWELRFHLSDCPPGGSRPATSAKVTGADPSTNARGPTPPQTSDRPPVAQLDRPRSQSAPPVYSEAYLVREFDRRERERGPIFAGFIVNELIPGMGFDVLEAKQILRTMEAKDMVRSERKPNPKDPERQTTFITLNRAHPHVERVLKGTAATKRVFPVATIKGEPLSETIIRERR